MYVKVKLGQAFIDFLVERAEGHRQLPGRRPAAVRPRRQRPERLTAALPVEALRQRDEHANTEHEYG
jgi:hypothetical protein